MNHARYAYVGARVSMLASELLTPAALSDLVDRDAADLSHLAHIEALGDVLARRDGDTGVLEQALITRLLTDAEVLHRPLSEGDRRFCDYCHHWFELANLKAIIRGKLSGLPDQEIRRQLVDTTPFVTLPIDELLRTEDPAEMLRRLEATSYSDIARQARIVYEDKKDPFALDAAIDRRFFLGLQRRANGVDPNQRHAVQSLVGCLIDRFNLMWLLRYRFSYGISPAESYYLLVPVGHLLPATTLKELARLGSFEEVIQGLPNGLRELLAGSENLTELENRMEEQTRHVMQTALRDNRHAVARAFALLVLRELELRNLLAVIKGRKLGLSPDLIRFAAAIPPGD